MADISKININDSSEYNIKDTTARDGLTDRPTSFVGTRLEWNALPVATQVKYSLVNLIGEGVYKNNGTGLDDIANTGGGGTKNFQGTIEEWNQLTTAEKKAYDHASIPDSIDGGVTFPADKVIMTGGGNVEDALNTQRVVTVASVTANGVKTYRQLLNEIYTSQTGNDNVILSLGGEMHQQYFGVTYYGGLMTTGGGLLLSFIRLDSTNSQYKTYVLTASSSPIEDKSLLVPAQGTVIKLIKFL